MISLALSLALLSAPPVVETPVALTSTPAPLYGTLASPEGPTRAVAVILPGSGPTDRNGDNAAFNVRAGSLRLLAEGLAAHGVATLRIDKRGVAESAPAGSREADLRFGQLADDARAWAAEAARRTGQRCAWLIGHSEGALVALDAAAAKDPAICGLVLISGAGRPASLTLHEQLAAQLPPEALQAVDAAFADLNAGRTTTPIPGLEALLRPSVQPYLISWFALDPARLLADYAGPVLVVSGSHDLQIPPAEADALTALRPDAPRLDIEGMNHVMKIAPADRAGNFVTYADPSLPLAPGLADGVADFVLTGGVRPRS